MKKGTIVYCNSSFAEMVKQPLQKVTGRSFNNFITDANKSHVKDLLEQGWEHNIKDEVYIQAPDGTVVPVLMTASALLTDDTSVLSIILTDLTIQNNNKEVLRLRATQMEDLNVELESANKELSTFTYVSSHDLQEPLRKIRNFISILLRSDEQKQTTGGVIYLKKIQETAVQMQQLLEDLLKYSITKNSEHTFEETDVAVIVEEVKKDLEEALLQKKAIIEVVPHQCSINIIRFQFLQLFQNLITNSLKFSKPGTPPHIIIKSEMVKGSALQYEKNIKKKITTATLLIPIMVLASTHNIMNVFLKSSSA